MTSPPVTPPPELRDLAAALKKLRAGVNNPSYDAMVARAKETGVRVVKSSLSRADKGLQLPGWKVTQAYVLGCKDNPADWLGQWESARAAVDGTRPRPVAVPRPVPASARPVTARLFPDPATATVPADFRALLQDLYRGAGLASPRLAAARARSLGVTLSRGAIQNLMDAGNKTSVPRLATVKALLAVCDVPPDRCGAWLERFDAINRRGRAVSAVDSRPARGRRRNSPPRRPAGPRRPNAAPVHAGGRAGLPTHAGAVFAAPAREGLPLPAGAGLVDRRSAPAGPGLAASAATPGGARPAASAATPGGTGRHRGTGLVPLLCCLLLLTCLPATDTTGPHLRQQHPAHAIPDLPAVLSAPAGPAHDELLALAVTARSSADPLADGRYTHVRTQTWCLDTTAFTATGIAPGADPVRATEDDLWWAPDGRARESSTPLPGLPAGDRHRDRRSPIVAPARTVYDHPVGEFRLAVSDPSVSPTELADQLSRHNPVTNGPHATLQAVSDMYKQQHLSDVQRAAVLEVLAGINGLQNRGPTTDRAGRPGIAISADTPDGTARHLAIFDRETGDLLSYEEIILVSPPRTSVRAPILRTYVLYLAHSRTDTQE